MNMQLSSGFGSLAFLAILWGLFVTVMWMVIGWRAMKAHEKIADAVQEHFRQRP
jgi:hypothetical protein